MRAYLIAFDFWLARRIGAPAHHTLSGYAWEAEQRGKWWGRFWRPRIDLTFFVLFKQSEHCRKAYEREKSAA